MKNTKVRRLNGVVVVTPQRNLLGSGETDELEEVVKTLDAEAVKCLVVNLGEIKIMTSAGIRVLIHAHMNFAKRGGRINLCCVDHGVTHALTILKLTRIFDCFDREDQAIAGCVEVATQPSASAESVKPTR